MPPPTCTSCANRARQKRWSTKAVADSTRHIKLAYGVCRPQSTCAAEHNTHSTAGKLHVSRVHALWLADSLRTAAAQLSALGADRRTV